MLKLVNTVTIAFKGQSVGKASEPVDYGMLQINSSPLSL